jgi:plasmid stabilization system protein ParE
MIPIDFHLEATRELEQSVAWYLERSGTAAKGFALAVDAALDKISQTPERFPRVDRRHRAGNLKKYPFQIIYRREDKRIYVIAVAHAKRRPGYWRTRSIGTP